MDYRVTIMRSEWGEREIEAVYAIELVRGVVLSLLIYPREEWDDPPHRALPLQEVVVREGVVL